MGASVERQSPRSGRLEKAGPECGWWPASNETRLRNSALFEHRVRPLVYFMLFRLRHPTGISCLGCTSFGVAGVSLVFDRVSALVRFGEVARGKSPAAGG